MCVYGFLYIYINKATYRGIASTQWSLNIFDENSNINAAFDETISRRKSDTKKK